MSVHVRCPKCSAILEHHVIPAGPTGGVRQTEHWCPNCKVEVPVQPKPKATTDDEDMLVAFGRDLDGLIDRYAAETNLRAAETVGMLMFKVQSILTSKPKA